MLYARQMPPPRHWLPLFLVLSSTSRSAAPPILEHRVELHLYAGVAIDAALEARADRLILAGKEVAELLAHPRLLKLPTAMVGATSKRDGLFVVAVAPTAVFVSEDVAAGFEA